MLRGLYTAGWGMISKNKSMDVISNNLANVNTVGYKRDDVIFESFEEVLVGRINDGRGIINPTRIVGDARLGADAGEVFTNHEMGNVKYTGRSLDMAIDGQNGVFFTIGIEDDEGEFEEHFTRNGVFTLNQDGVLVNLDGYPVLGENGQITLDNEDFIVREDGTIEVEEQEMDTLLLRAFDDTRDLIKRGDNLFSINPELDDEEAVAPEVENYVVRQGYLEGANVNSVKEMVNMIEVLRAYESNQKVVHSMDEIIQKAVNEVGRI